MINFFYFSCNDLPFSTHLSREIFHKLLGNFFSEEYLNKSFTLLDKGKNNQLDSYDFEFIPTCDCHFFSALVTELPSNLEEHYSFKNINNCDWYFLRENAYKFFNTYGYSPLDQSTCKKLFES